MLKMDRKILNNKVSEAINGDEHAQEDLCKLFSKSVYMNVSNRLTNQNDIEDVSQEVLIQALKSIHTLKSPYAFSSWLNRIVINTCNNKNVQGAKHDTQALDPETHESLLRIDEREIPDHIIEQADQCSTILTLIAELPKAQQTSLLMYYFDDMSYKEIAEELNVTVGTVSYNISKAKERLKDLIAECKIDSVELQGDGMLGVTAFVRLCEPTPSDASRANQAP
jgi:RNA polymerase sigma-70 factor (ECF subfamily)